MSLVGNDEDFHPQDLPVGDDLHNDETMGIGEMEEEQEDPPLNGMNGVLTNSPEHGRMKRRKHHLDPSLPKKICTAFLFYSKERHAQLRQARHDKEKCDVTQIARMIGEEWRDMDPARKAHYVALEDAEKARYSAEKRDWERMKEVEKHTGEPPAEMVKSRREMAERASLPKAPFTPTTRGLASV